MTVDDEPSRKPGSDHTAQATTGAQVKAELATTTTGTTEAPEPVTTTPTPPTSSTTPSSKGFLSPLAKEFSPSPAVPKMALSPAMSPQSMAAIRSAHLTPYSPPFSPGVAPAYISLSPSMDEWSLGKVMSSGGRGASQRAAVISPRNGGGDPVSLLMPHHSVSNSNSNNANGNGNGNGNGSNANGHGNGYNVAAPVLLSTLRASGRVVPSTKGGGGDQSEAGGDPVSLSTVAAAATAATASTATNGETTNDDVSLEDLVRRQIEYYFSHENLLGDKFLVEEMGKDPQGFVSLPLVTSLKRIRALNVDVDFVAGALKGSKRLVVDTQNKRVRRKKKFTANTGTNPTFLRKCLRVSGLSPDCTVEDVKKRFDIIMYREDSELPFLENHSVYVKFEEDSDRTWAWVGFTTALHARMFVQHPPPGLSCITKLDHLKQLKQDNKAKKAERRRNTRAKSVGERVSASPPSSRRNTCGGDERGSPPRSTSSATSSSSASASASPSNNTTTTTTPQRQRRRSTRHNSRKDKTPVSDPRFQRSSDANATRPRFLLSKRRVSDASAAGIRMAKGPDGTDGFAWVEQHKPPSLFQSSSVSLCAVLPE